MKHDILSILSAAAAIVLSCTSCLYENHFDVAISYTTTSSGSTSSVEQYLQYLKTVSDAYETAFSESGLEPLGTHTWVMREQTGTSKAESTAIKIASRAHASLNGFRCPLDDLSAIVKISDGSGSDTEVARHQYGLGD